jgi:hypothetical protein
MKLISSVLVGLLLLSCSSKPSLMNKNHVKKAIYTYCLEKSTHQNDFLTEADIALTAFDSQKYKTKYTGICTNNEQSDFKVTFTNFYTPNSKKYWIGKGIFTAVGLTQFALVWSNNLPWWVLGIHVNTDNHQSVGYKYTIKYDNTETIEAELILGLENLSDSLAVKSIFQTAPFHINNTIFSETNANTLK